MTKPHDTIDSRTWQLLVLLSVLWGGAFFFIGFALHELPPMTIVFARVALGAVFLLPVLWMTGGALPRDRCAWWSFFVMSLLNNVLPFSLLAFGQTYVSSGLTAVLNATTPLFSVLVLGAAGLEPVLARRVVGVLLGIAGVMILRGHDASSQTTGIVLCLGAALSYGVSGLWARLKLQNVPAVTSSAGQLICSTIVMAFVAAAVDQPWRLAVPGAATVLALLGLGAFGTSLAYIVFFTIIRRSGATNTMLVTLLIPVTAILLGHFILGEQLTLREIVGALAIGSALLVIDGRPLAWLRRMVRAAMA